MTRKPVRSFVCLLSRWLFPVVDASVLCPSDWCCRDLNIYSGSSRNDHFLSFDRRKKLLTRKPVRSFVCLPTGRFLLKRRRSCVPTTGTTPVDLNIYSGSSRNDHFLNLTVGKKRLLTRKPVRSFVCLLLQSLAVSCRRCVGPVSLQLVLLLPKHLQWWLRIRRRVAVRLAVTYDRHTHARVYASTFFRTQIEGSLYLKRPDTALHVHLSATTLWLIFELLFCVRTYSYHIASY